MRRVVIESPYAGDVAANLIYVRRALRDSLYRGEAPFASHALYTQFGVLSDSNPDERSLGITAGFTWGQFTEAAVFYVDYGMSSGMWAAVAHWQHLGIPYEERTIGKNNPANEGL